MSPVVPTATKNSFEALIDKDGSNEVQLVFGEVEDLGHNEQVGGDPSLPPHG